MSPYLLTTRAKKFLVAECSLVGVLATLLIVLTFFHNFTFHFQQVTLNFYTNGKFDFTADATSLVRSLGVVAVLTLFVGVVTGAAIGITCSLPPEASAQASGLSAYERELTKLGFVVINKADGETTYTLTDHGRRFLKEYRFLEKVEEVDA